MSMTELGSPNWQAHLGSFALNVVGPFICTFRCLGDSVGGGRFLDEYTDGCLKEAVGGYIEHCDFRHGLCRYHGGRMPAQARPYRDWRRGQRGEKKNPCFGSLTDP